MIKIRQATIADLHALLDIYNHVIEHTTAVYDYQPHTREMREEWFQSKQQQGFPVFVAEELDELIGFSSIGPFRAWAAYRYTVENSVYVKEGHRGKGIAALLMRPLIDAARTLQLHTIVAGIDSANEASIRLHQKFGFKQVAHFKEVGYKFDRWLDLVFMQLIL